MKPVILRVTIPKLIIFGGAIFISLGIGIWVYNAEEAKPITDVWDCGDDTSNVTCTFNSEGVLRISGIGAIKENVSKEGNLWKITGASVTTLIIEKGVTSIEEYAFYGYINLRSVKIANTVKSIGKSAFAFCKSLRTITIPNSVTKIECETFAYCADLKSIRIPNSVTEIEYGAFSFCTGLTSIKIAAGNPNYSSKDGVLFNKDKTILKWFPEGKRGAYMIPNGVTSAYLRNSIAITSVTIPSSMEIFFFFINTDSSNLASVISLKPMPPTFNINESIEACLYVPSNGLNVYRAAEGWKYFECIKPLEDAPKVKNKHIKLKNRS